MNFAKSELARTAAAFHQDATRAIRAARHFAKEGDEAGRARACLDAARLARAWAVSLERCAVWPPRRRKKAAMPVPPPAPPMEDWRPA